VQEESQSPSTTIVSPLSRMSEYFLTKSTMIPPGSFLMTSAWDGATAEIITRPARASALRAFIVCSDFLGADGRQLNRCAIRHKRMTNSSGTRVISRSKAVGPFMAHLERVKFKSPLDGRLPDRVTENEEEG
jgi:hypothetical protein